MHKNTTRSSLHYVLMVLALSAASCSSDSVDPPVGGGGIGGGTEDRVELRVYTTEDSGEILRWVGNSEGPFAESPEATQRPYIGFGRSFRIEWVITSERASITGYQFRPSQVIGGPWLPLDANGVTVWGPDTSFSFGNNTAPEVLVGEDCDTGEDCPDRLRFESGLHRFEVVALDATGVESDVDQGRLEFDVNYPPETTLVVDTPSGCDDASKFPQYRVTPVGDDPMICNFAPGDTIPAGAWVTVKLGGFDRVATSVMADSFCCDVRLDPVDPEVRYQGRLQYVAVTDLGLVDSLMVGFAPEADGAELTFLAGPFDYTFIGRTKDEHGRPDRSDVEFSFVAGFPPRVLNVEPAENANMVLKGPGTDSWPENEVPYTVETDVTRYWDSEILQYFRSPGENRQQTSGSIYRIPLRFVGASDARELPTTDSEASDFVGAVRAWAYEFSSEGDPDNELPHGGGLDDIARFTNSSAPDVWALDGDDAMEIFIPFLIWENFDLFDPDGACSVPVLCEQGQYLLRELGRMTVRVRGKTTGLGASICPSPPIDDPSLNDCVSEVDLSLRGRRSAIFERRFNLQLGIPDDAGARDFLWPEP